MKNRSFQLIRGAVSWYVSDTYQQVVSICMTKLKCTNLVRCEK